MRADKSTALPAYCFSNSIEACSGKALQFDRHYLLYCARGSLRIDVADRYWILPPSRALWIPAGTEIHVDIKQRIDCCSLLFATDFIQSPFEVCQVLTLPHLLQEMILHAKQWGPQTEHFDELARHFFASIVHMCGQLKHQPSVLWVPKGHSDKVRKALLITQQHLAEPITFASIAQDVASTERSLARAFKRETKMSWTQIQRQMRMIEAIELLSQSNQKILAISLAVGYQSLSSFNRAFKDFTSMTPKEFSTEFY